jgi:hypothetical protein
MPIPARRIGAVLVGVLADIWVAGFYLGQFGTFYFGKG